MALTFIRPLFWIASFMTLFLLIVIARKTRLRWLPAFFLRLILLMLLVFEFFAARNPVLGDRSLPLEVLLLDQSDSLSLDLRKQMHSEALQWRREAANRVVIEFGSEARWIKEEFEPNFGRATNLHEALRLALPFLQNSSVRLIIASDGITSDLSQVEGLIEEFQKRNISVDVLPLLPREVAQDIALKRLVVPQFLWAKSSFRAYLEVFSPEAASVEIALKLNGEPSVSKTFQLTAGTQWIEFPLQAEREGILSLETTLTYAADPYPQNNSAYGVMQIFPMPKVLILTHTPEELSSFAETLRKAGLDADVRSPLDMSVDGQEFANYQVIMLANLLATWLSEAQMAALYHQVTDFGSGLVITGGKNSLTLGGYLDTPIESILPVKLEPPPRKARSPLTFVIMMDASGSMGSKKGGNLPPIVLAAEAAARAIERMQPKDYFGLMSFQTTPTWRVPIRLLGDGLAMRSAMDAVMRINASGGTKLYSAMSECLNAMNQENPPTESKNLLILSDGKSSDGKLEDFISITQEMNQAGWNVSVVAFGEQINAEILTAIATAGKGRYHHVRIPEDLPRVMIAESKSASGENIQEGKTNLIAAEADHPLLGGFSIDELPAIEVYNAVTSRKEEGAEDVLVSASFGDPILAARQAGFGRVIVWATDLGQGWSPDWQTWQRTGEFWKRILQYALPNPAFGKDRVEVQAEEDKVTITAYLEEIGNPPPSRGSVEYLLNLGTTVQPYRLMPLEIGVYQGQISIEQNGAFSGVVRFQRDNQSVDLPVSFALNPPREWLPPDREEGKANLERWARQTNGEILSALPQPGLENEVKQEQNASNLSLLLVIALIAWPVEIAIRRRWLPWV